MDRPTDQFPFAESRAAGMLREGIARQASVGRSLRSLGTKLGYKQATVLSHMAKGRVPIPLERARDIAAALEIAEPDFLGAVVEQRVPGASALLSEGNPSFGLASDLTQIAGSGLDQLSPEQKSVMKEVAADPHPRRRWLAVAEIPYVNLVRSLRKGAQQEGLSEKDLARMREALR